MRKITTIIIVLLLIALGYVGYNMLTKDEEAESITITENTSVDSVSGLPTASSDEFLALLNSLREVKFDTTIFQDRAFTSLQDFHRPLPDRSVGREDPFSPYVNQAAVQFSAQPQPTTAR